MKLSEVIQHLQDNYSEADNIAIAAVSQTELNPRINYFFPESNQLERNRIGELAINSIAKSGFHEDDLELSVDVEAREMLKNEKLK